MKSNHDSVKPKKSLNSSRKSKNSKKGQTEEENSAALDRLNSMSQRFLEDMGFDLQEYRKDLPIKNESESETEESDELSEYSQDEELPTPKVIIFKEEKSVNNAASKAGKRSFLASNIKALDKSKPTKPILNKEEEKEEAENDVYDKELEKLLNDSKLIEKLAVSQISGKAKRKFQMKQLEELGAKPMKNYQQPISHRLKVVRDKKRKVDRIIEEAKEQGNYHKSIRHVFTGEEKNKPKKKSSELKTSLGRFKEGVLHISKAHIKRNAQKAKSKGSVTKTSFRGF